MKRKILATLLIAAMAISLASAAMAKEVTHMWVKRSAKHVMLYEEPDGTSMTLCHVPAGKKVNVFLDFYDAGWFNCSYKGYYGYIRANKLTSNKPKPKPTHTPKPLSTPTPRPKATPNHTPDTFASEEAAMFAGFESVHYTATIVTQNPDSTVHVRWSPTTKSPCVADYKAGVELEVLYENSEWAQVHSEQDDITGFVFKTYLEKVADTHMDEVDVNADPEGLINPVHEVASLTELLAAVPNIAMLEPPEGAYEETYSWIEGDPAVAQITFGLGEDYYTYRAAFAKTEDEVSDIDGVHLTFDEEEVLDGLFKNGFEINLRTLTTDKYAVADWYYPSEQTQFSLFSETAGYPEMRIVTVAEALVPIDGDSEEWALNAEE